DRNSSGSSVPDLAGGTGGRAVEDGELLAQALEALADEVAGEGAGERVEIGRRRRGAIVLDGVGERAQPRRRGAGEGVERGRVDGRGRERAQRRGGAERAADAARVEQHGHERLLRGARHAALA